MTDRVRRLALCTFGLSLALGSLAVLAAESAAKPAIASVFPRSYFASARPANALDMLLRVPGFVIVEADPDVRGYAAAQGNVLIDGALPSSKRDDIQALLKRIPAASVQAIELIASARPGIDMGGHRLLANVVRTVDEETETAVELGAVASTDGWSAPLLKLEHARHAGGNGFELALDVAAERDDDSGSGQIETLAPGGTTRRSALRVGEAAHTIDASAKRSQAFAGGQLHSSLALRRERVSERIDIDAEDSAADDEQIEADETLREAEAGLRYSRALGSATRMDLVATAQRGWLDASERALEGEDVEAFDETTSTGEDILRLELGHSRSEALSLTFAFERALNFLESDARLSENGEAVPVPGTQVRIEERRHEVGFGLVWTPAPDWVLEAGLRHEASDIEQTGDTTLSRRFSHPKPRLAVRWDADPRNQFRLALSREVGQLDFGDFVASASLDSDVVSAGNAELAPDTRWSTTAAWQHEFLAGGALTLQWVHDEISDVIDRVLVTTPTEIFDAPGNIGDGSRDTLSAEFSTPLDGIGLRHAQLRTAALWRRSRVIDPVTGEQRGISEERPFEGSVALTQDLPELRLNWGLALDHIAERERSYRFDEIADQSEDMGWNVFVERRVGSHWRWRAEITDLFGRNFRERKERSSGPRDSMPLEEIETRQRRAPGVVSLTFRRSTGG
jgi:hypothetical protein